MKPIVAEQMRDEVLRRPVLTPHATRFRHIDPEPVGYVIGRDELDQLVEGIRELNRERRELHDQLHKAARVAGREP